VTGILLGREAAAEALDVGASSFDKLRDLPGFPKPTWLDSRPRWLAADLMTWASSLPTSVEKPEPGAKPVRHRRSKHDPPRLESVKATG
jgi:hypothetical protein